MIPIFLLTAVYFDRWTALLAAAFWAVGINAITHNRIGKEDSLLVFFMLFAFFFFARAKASAAGHARTSTSLCGKRCFVWVDDRFEIFPSLIGLNMLFHHYFHLRKAVAGEPSGRVPGWFFLTIIGVFLLANPRCSFLRSGII